MDIKDYSKTKIDSFEPKKIDEKDLKKAQDGYADLVQEFMKRYGTMSEKQMIDEMMLLVEKKKKEGTFNIDEIREITQKVKPFLSFEQQNYVEELLAKIS